MKKSVQERRIVDEKRRAKTVENIHIEKSRE
jgi:hypothetical protein